MRPLLDLVAGARPNFMKVAPVVRALQKERGLHFRIVHTGQHYDPAMTDVFFEELGIPAPGVHLEALPLLSDAKVVLTGSGGLQEETTALRVPCLALRENTERPITVEKGTSRLVGNDPGRIRAAFRDVLRGDGPPGDEIPLWDGHAGEREARRLAEWMGDPGH